MKVWTFLRDPLQVCYDWNLSASVNGERLLSATLTMKLMYWKVLFESAVTALVHLCSRCISSVVLKAGSYVHLYTALSHVFLTEKSTLDHAGIMPKCGNFL